MKSKGLIFICLFCVSFKAYPQYYFYDDRYYENAVVLEFGGSVGAMNSLTDLGGKKGKGKAGGKGF